MPFLRQLCLLLLTMSIAMPTPAADPALLVEGQPFVRHMTLAGQGLVLNGIGVRAVAWFKGYAAGLYLPHRAATAEDAVTQGGPKRLQMRMLQEVPPDEFVKAVRKGMARNSPDAEHEALQERVERFAAAIHAAGTVRKGDVVDLDFDPARGLLFSLNGTLRGEAIPGADFYAALLRSFIGDKPYDDRLKAGLLGRPI